MYLHKFSTPLAEFTILSIITEKQQLPKEPANQVYTWFLDNKLPVSYFYQKTVEKFIIKDPLKKVQIQQHTRSHVQIQQHTRCHKSTNRKLGC